MLFQGPSIAVIAVNAALDGMELQDMPMGYEIRTMHAHEYPLLEGFLYDAIE